MKLATYNFMFKNTFRILLLVMSYLLLVNETFAAPADQVLSLLNRASNILFSVGIIAAIFGFIWMGLRLILAGLTGNSDATESAKKGFLFLMGGLIIMLIAFSLPRLICRFVLPSGCPL